MNEDIVKFYVHTSLGSFKLPAKSWEDVPNTLYSEEYVNSGKVRVTKHTYRLIDTVPHMFDTDC